MAHRRGETPASRIAGVDQELGSVALLHPRGDAEGCIARKVMKAAEQLALLGFDRRLRVGLEKLVATFTESLEDIGAAQPVQVPDAAPPVDQVEEVGGDCRHQVSQWTIGSSGIRSAGLNSPPSWNPTVIRAACV